VVLVDLIGFGLVMQVGIIRLSQGLLEACLSYATINHGCLYIPKQYQVIYASRRAVSSSLS
jgi:hypothetical protein